MQPRLARNPLALTVHLALLLTAAASSHHYIVTLTTYHPLPQQERLVRSALSLTASTTWHLLPRHNLAARTLPTDFVLLESSTPAIAATLLLSPCVRAVTRESEHTRLPRALLRQQTPDFADPIPVPNASSRFAASPPTIHAFGAGSLWRRGFLGAGVKVAVFDTGLIEDAAYFPNVVDRTDWTGENTTADNVGHGTFVAGLIAGSHPACPGIAPHALLYTFRVFTGAQVSYTSWFLDAFNYALHIGIDILNLSIGGPDFADNPFTEKVNELTANGVIVVSAIGNDGPLWGSLNNPGDMMEVVGVGGAEPDGTIARFSSRGMTTHELDGLHTAYGRVKPDLVAYGRSLVGPSHKSALKCRKLSGTSVASPVVAGAIALLASTVPESRRRKVVNSASVKRALIQSSHRLRESSIYEQGSGLLDINDAYAVLREIDSEFLLAMQRYEKVTTLAMRLSKSNRRASEPNLAATRAHADLIPAGDVAHDLEDVIETENTIPGPTAAFFPSFYDLTAEGCPHMWPHCAQPLFKGGMPVTLNATVLNPGGVHGRVESINWINGVNGEYLDVKVTPPCRFWPWAAGLGIHLSVTDEPRFPIHAEGMLKVRIVSVHERTHSDVFLPIKVAIVSAPKREQRLLWDAYHSIRYPPGYVPRDSLSESKDMLDWLGDHPHTNFHSLFRTFMQAGFFVDILDSPITCLSTESLSQYGGLLILDSEDYFSTNETKLIAHLVKDQGLALIIAAEWYNPDVMRDIRFEDDNTRSWWSPVVAGGNVPALNDLLAPFSISLGEAVLSGEVKLQSGSFRFESGVPIVRFPRGGEVLYVPGLQLYESKRNRHNSIFSDDRVPEMPILGLAESGSGAVLVYGDTNCIDTAYSGERCYDFFVEAVRHSVQSCAAAQSCEKMLSQSRILEKELVPTSSRLHMVARLPSSVSLELFKPHSKVLRKLDRVLKIRALSSTDETDEPICSLRNVFQQAVSVASAHLRSSILLPRQKRAEPLGSEGKYFQSVGYRWRYNMKRQLFNGSSTNDEVIQGFIRPRLLSSMHVRSVFAILTGIGLIIMSFSMRHRKVPCLLYVRRNSRLRHARSRQTASSSSSSRSGCDVVASRTICSLLGLASSSGLHDWRKPVGAP